MVCDEGEAVAHDRASIDVSMNPFGVCDPELSEMLRTLLKLNKCRNEVLTALFLGTENAEIDPEGMNLISEADMRLFNAPVPQGPSGTGSGTKRNTRPKPANNIPKPKRELMFS